VCQPDVVSLLSSEGEQSNTNNNSSDNHNSEETSSHDIRNSGWELDDSALVVSVADTTLINDSSWEWVQKATVSLFSAKGLVASSKKSLDSGDAETIHWWILASKNRVTSILSAGFVVKASDVLVNTSSGWDARVNGASASIITVSGIERNKVASSHRVAHVLGALVSIVADLSDSGTVSSDQIARINGASVSVIANNWGSNAFSVIVVALVSLAFDGSTGDVEALIARNDGMGASYLGNSGGNASVISAWVKVFTALGGVLASNCWVARWDSANIGSSADSGGSLTSQDVVAEVISAEVSIIANDVGIGASVSVGSLSAGSSLAFESVIAGRWADAGSTSAKSFASSSAGVTWNVDASGLDELVENSSQSGEAGHIRVRSGDSSNGGREGSQKVTIGLSSDSNREDDDSSSLGVGDNSRISSSVDVVQTVCKYDHDLGDLSSRIVDFCLSSLNSATNASVSSSLASSVDSVDKGSLNKAHSDDNSGISVEHNKTHSSILRSKGVGLGKADSKSLES